MEKPVLDCIVYIVLEEEVNIIFCVHFFLESFDYSQSLAVIKRTCVAAH